jgi:prophage DNA circulation protein
MSEALTSIAGFSASLPWVGANLRPAALRGLLFYARRSEETSVRRWVTHEFPGRDEPWHEDLGAKTRSFSIDGILIGPDVVLQARAFRRAAADPAPATFLHPWLGAMQVVVLDCRVELDVDRARVANVSLRLEIAGTKPAPVIGTDGLGSVLAEADRLLTAGQAVWAQYRYLRAMADFAIANFKASVEGIAGAIESALANTGLGGSAAAVAALGWDDVWQRLVALRAASAADLAERAAPLPRIKRVELPGVMPSTVIAYQLDGDSISDLFGRAAALSARNRVRHPGFVPSASPIEVLA